jgi:hypothetical protein
MKIFLQFILKSLVIVAATLLIFPMFVYTMTKEGNEDLLKIINLD